jgi:pimeloyl-ACP methyl ester carboxylesterase
MLFLLRSLSFVALILLSSCVSVRERSGLSSMVRAHQAWQQLQAEGDSSAARSAYALAVTEVVRELCLHKHPSEWTNSLSTLDGSIVHLDSGLIAHRCWQPQIFDEIKPAKLHHPPQIANALRPGIGATFVGIRERDEADADASFVYRKGQHVPITVILEFKGSDASTAVLHLYDPREVSSITLGAHVQPLAADFASPVQAVLDKRSFLRTAFGGLLRPGRFLGDDNLFVQEPYRADKVPVIFVHGLMSDPHIWENEVTALMSDPELGKRVQCWCFVYPTGLPVAASSARLRTSLQKADKFFDPKHHDAGLRNAMLIGHSMGGLLARMQVIESGEAFWRTWFKLPPGQVKLDQAIDKAMRDALLFHPNPDVKRVVFIATPHRGADMADGWIGRLGARLIKLPENILHIATSVATLDPDIINPARLVMNEMGANSISNLSPSHPVIEALNTCKVPLPCHSIIAVKEPKPDVRQTSDGVVPYRSSHVDFAKTETYVTSDHGCVEKPATVAEVLHLVREHVRAVR